MATPLSERQRRRLAAGLALLALAYFFLIGKEFAASVLASHSDLAKLQRAVSLSPGNADYRHRLGAFLAFGPGDPQAAVDSYRSAVALNPYDASYWLDLAAADQVTGDLDGQRAALHHALAAEPTAPDVAWKAANFFLVDGQIDPALREFRVVIENDLSLSDAALHACWRVRPDADALLQEVVPVRVDSLFMFLSLLMSKQETAGSIKTFQRLAGLHEKFDSWRLFEYIRYLIQVRRPDAAMAAWEQAAPTLGLSAYLPTNDNLIINGDFSLDVLNGGFDWTYVNRTGVRPLLDSSDFREGQRSLSLTFEGPGIADAGIQQLIPVRGATTYDFSAYYKTADFAGAGGPQIVLRDAYSGTPLYTSDPLTDADFWKEVHSKITTPDSTTLLSLTIERFPAGSPIRGKLWLDDFQLAPDSNDSKDHS
jgi:tetratricopeptide (TPR) repeat protein